MKLIIITNIFLITLITSTTSNHFKLSRNPLIDIILRNSLPTSIKLPANFTPSPSITRDSIQQRVNHFDPLNDQTFAHHFFINDEFFQPNGPLVIYLHANPYDDGLNMAYLSIGPAYDLAREFNGRLVYPQHRYFEDSHVTDDLSTENLRFLSVNHALEDLAHLIVHLRESSSTNVLLVGWDYGGSLATWFAQKYSHLVTGIWTSGARLSPELGHNEPVTYVENMLRITSDECFNRVENGFRQFDDMFANNQSNIIRRRFNFCFPMPYTAGDWDIMYFYEIMVTNFYFYAQFYDEFYAREFACGALMNAPVEHDWEALGYVFNLMSIPFPLCYPNSFDHQMDIVKEQLALDSEFGYARALLYLECVDFGFFFNSGEGASIFGGQFPREFFGHVCETMFG